MKALGILLTVTLLLTPSPGSTSALEGDGSLSETHPASDGSRTPPDIATTDPGAALPALTDAEVCGSVREALHSEPEIVARAELELECRDGVLTLSGEAETLQVLRQAMNRAADTRGVIDIIPGTVRITSAGVSDAEIALQIEDTLLIPSFRGDSIRVSVRKGRVRLLGTTATYARKLLAERAAAEAPGVVEVLNDLRVSAPPEGDDETLAARIRSLLTEGLAPIPGAIDVTVRNRKAYLEGRVALYSHRLRAERLALSVGGIASIENRLRVDPSFLALPDATTPEP